MSWSDFVNKIERFNRVESLRHHAATVVMGYQYCDHLDGEPCTPYLITADTPVGSEPKWIYFRDYRPDTDERQAHMLLRKLPPWYIEDDGLGTITAIVRGVSSQSRGSFPLAALEAVCLATGWNGE